MGRPVKLDIRKMLPVIRKAFDNKQLQMQTQTAGGHACLYRGPCAIGICLTPKQRDVFDTANLYGGSELLNTLFDRRRVTSDTMEEQLDLTELQGAHDNAVGAGMAIRAQRINEFEKTLFKLERKYA